MLWRVHADPRHANRCQHVDDDQERELQFEQVAVRLSVSRAFVLAACAIGVASAIDNAGLAGAATSQIGQEHAITHHLSDDEEFTVPIPALIAFGEKLFSANWTDQDGGGRPFTKGTGQPLSNRARPLTGARAFNRISGPDANSCQGCHNAPYGLIGGSSDIVANAFEGAERFDFVTFDRRETKPLRGALDERGRPVLLQTVGNARVTPDLFGAGYLEMLARQITGDLQRIRDSMSPGQTRMLTSSGISFGSLRRRNDGSWDVTAVEGLPRLSLLLPTAAAKPSLVIRPWRQSATVVSIREFTNTAYNQHLGIQTTERFGVDTDPDGDGVTNEMTRADVTAVVAFQATLPVPGRVIPRNAASEGAIVRGEMLFGRLHCNACHVSTLPLLRANWRFVEPSPYNPPGNLRRADVSKTVEIDLTDATLPGPRIVALRAGTANVEVAAYTDFKLHDITEPSDPAGAEPLDLNSPPWSPQFTRGNRKFLTRRLWSVGNGPPYFHDGRFTTIRDAVIAHAGEARESSDAFRHLSQNERDDVIEFLKSLQVLPAGTKSLVVDEHGQPRTLPLVSNN
jgi:hypothetical protein